MKALSLTQPWASLVALGEKRVETRSWATKYTGPLAIHAAKGFPKWARETCMEEPFYSVLAKQLAIPSQRYGMVSEDLPRGAVLCIVKLMGCRRTEDVRYQLPEQELAFGDYAPGRFAWFLEFVEIVSELPLVCGHLGLWEWSRELKG